MVLTPPDWLIRHDGSLELTPDGGAWQVFFDGAPHYQVIPRPAEGRYTCVVVQTENGKRIDEGATYATPDEAVRGGLEELRSYLGW